MAAQRNFAEPADHFDNMTAPAARPAPLLASPSATPRVSPARLLQAELRRAFSPGPIGTDRFSMRRALKFIAPTWAGLWVFIALLGHVARH